MNNLNPLYEIYVLDENAFTHWLGRQTRRAAIGTALIGGGLGIGARQGAQAVRNVEMKPLVQTVQKLTKPGSQINYTISSTNAPQSFAQRVLAGKSSVVPTIKEIPAKELDAAARKGGVLTTGTGKVRHRAVERSDVSRPVMGGGKQTQSTYSFTGDWN